MRVLYDCLPIFWKRLGLCIHARLDTLKMFLIIIIISYNNNVTNIRKMLPYNSQKNLSLALSINATETMLRFYKTFIQGV